MTVYDVNTVSNITNNWKKKWRRVLLFCK